MAAIRTSRTFDSVFIGGLAILLILAALNRTAVGDWVFFSTHRPAPEGIDLASRAGLTPAASRLLYRTNPRLEDAAAVAADCGSDRLGCLSGRGQSFILDDPAKPNQTVVTAAHEMLHVAYQRLSQAKRDQLAPLIDQAITENTPAIASELTSDTDTSDRRDEAHSLLGSEYANLPPQLENYYAQYFEDRSKLVRAAASSR